MTPLLTRLRERKLVQWAVAYLGGAWLVLQVLDVLAQPFAWQDRVVQAASILLGIGLFAVLVLAWYHGERGQQRASGIELLMLAGILVIAGAAVGWMGGSGRGGAPETRGVAAPSPDALAPPPMPVPTRSIAVLPFTNLSESKENEYFSNGITDEILTTLANVGDLAVISRTSVMQYKDAKKPIRQIASELGVAYVLEGSVQRSEGRVRITAQLIDATKDAHLWAARYDRPLEDIFTLQSEIAQQIAEALQARLSPAERRRMERRPTANVAAHDYLLRGSEFVRRYTPDDNEIGLSLLRKARALDPAYPDAHAGLAGAYLLQYMFLGDPSWLDSMIVSARRAVTLDPELAEGHSWLGWSYDFQGEGEAALQSHLRAVRLNPGASDGLANVYHYGFGRLDEAARWWTPAIERDPTNNLTYWLAGRTYLHLGMTARARALFEKAIEFQPGMSWPYFHTATTYLLEGKPGEAGAQIQRMLATTNSHSEALLLAGQHALALGDLPAAKRYFEQGLMGATSIFEIWGTLGLAWVLQRSGEERRAREVTADASRVLKRYWGDDPRRPEDFVNLARLRVLQRDRAGALEALEEGVRRGWRLQNDGINEPILNSLRGNARFDRLMAEVKADVDRQRARVEREGW